jgi:hypothetical protein
VWYASAALADEKSGRRHDANRRHMTSFWIGDEQMNWSSYRAWPSRGKSD